MEIQKLEENLQSLISNLNEDTFIFDLLLAYEQPKAAITRLQKGDYNLSKKHDEVLWKKRLCFKKENSRDLHNLIDELKNDPAIIKHHPRFIVVTDFQTLLSVDTKTEDTLDILISELPKHYDFFLPWAGMEKSQFQSENPADIKAAVRMAKLYDIILQDNLLDNKDTRHALNVFLSRLLFCFFAEDTAIFSEDQFTSAIASHTSEDGSDLQAYLQRLFKVLNLKERPDYPKFLQAFPYVNGGLFVDDYSVPKLNSKSRKIIIECGALNWKEINPDIFGSMMQAVVHSEDRSSVGMHYTSVLNIKKVIEPLLLNDLYDEFERADSNEKKLEKLLKRLYRLRIFDPACGSGNFLIIVYKELCRLEIKIYKRLQQINENWRTAKSGLHLNQFYGIELDDFAHETAKLSLWLAEHQMNLAFKEVFGESRPTLPLTDSGNILFDNATNIDWEIVCPQSKNHEIYILGNPPYMGARNQDKEQKKDVRNVLTGIRGVNSLDYITCWFFKAAEYIRDSNFQCAFVTTNSICQGDQVGLFWPHILSKGIEIGFAYESFKWTNSARSNAGVACIIVGIRSISKKNKYIYNKGIARKVKNISPYLTANKNIFIHKRTNPLSSIPEMEYGNQPIEGGYLKLSKEEYEKLLDNYPNASPFIRKLIGGGEFLKGQSRWCLWIETSDLQKALNIKPIKERIKKVEQFRIDGGEVANSLVNRPHQFRYRHEAKDNFLLIPQTSSENRSHMPIGFFEKEYISLHSAQIIYDPPLYIFAVISSRIHMTWIRAVAGRLENRIRYSSALCYNTFPFPQINASQKTILENHVFKVLEEREQHSEKTIAELYDPEKMPIELQRAHHEMDNAIEQCYRKSPFKSDEERLEYLFKIYEEMIEAEGKKGKSQCLI